jgi:ferredoxin
MCQFCHEHGEGKKWYLRAENYAEDLMSDLRRRKVVTDFFSHPEQLRASLIQMVRLDKAPAFVQRMIKSRVTRQMKRDHFGQVLPLEDVVQIFGFVNSIVRLPCICRHVTLRREARYCYGVSMGAVDGGMGEALQALDGTFLFGPDTSGLETLTAEEALAAFAEHEKEGLCHTVWTFVTPFIGGICNCDRADCMAMKATVGHDLKVMFRAEYVAEVNREECVGCRSCMRACQFGALGYSAADKKAMVEARACYGCGICRAACTKGAIGLRAREEVAAAKGLW